jgi:outer membrane protein assembly factor BamE (lipoprotein component of BamABCDE complex)
MKTVIAFTAVLAAATLAGCAAPGPVGPVAKQAQEEFRAIQAGQSTREDVLRLLGKPEREIVFSRLGEEVWDYRYQTTQHMLLSVHFATATGKVKHYTDIKDPAFHTCSGGSSC